MIRIVEPIQLIDLSNLVFIVEYKGVVKLGYNDWYPVDNIGVVSPLLEVDVARLTYHGLARIGSNGVVTTSIGKRSAEEIILPQDIVELGVNGWRNMALRYARLRIHELKSYASS